MRVSRYYHDSIESANFGRFQMIYKSYNILIMQNTKKRVLGVDFDDVLFSFNDCFLDYNRAKYGLDMKLSDLFDFDYGKTFPCPPEETIRRVLEFYDTREHMETAPIPGAIEGIRKLSKDYDIHIVTSRDEKLRPSVSEWIRDKFENLIDSMHFTGQYNAAHDHKLTKVDVCNDLGIEYFIEDALHNAIPIAESGRKVFLLDNPWNQSPNLHSNIIRVNSWDEIVRLLNE